jgi:hypothetical protein
MNSTYNFNPDDKRVQLAALLQDPTQPYRKYSGPLGAPSGSSGGMGVFNDAMMKMMMQGKFGKQPGAPGAVGVFPTGDANPMANHS